MSEYFIVSLMRQLGEHTSYHDTEQVARDMALAVKPDVQGVGVKIHQVVYNPGGIAIERVVAVV